MEQYHVLMFISRQQEMAIRNLFWQQGWAFFCRALPPALKDNAIIPLLQDFCDETNIYSDQCSAKPYSLYEDICRADDKKCYSNKHDFNGPEIIKGFSNINHFVEKNVQNEQRLVNDSSKSDKSFDDLHNAVDIPVVNTQPTIQNTCSNLEKENTNYMGTSNVNNKVIIDTCNVSDLDKTENVKTVDQHSVERNVDSNRVKADRGNQSQVNEKQGSSSQCKEMLDTLTAGTCSIKRNIIKSLDINNYRNPGKLSTADVTVAVSKNLEGTCKIIYTEDEDNTEVEQHDDNRNKLDQGSSESEQMKEIEKVTELTNEKGRIDIVLMHIDREKSLKKKIRNGVTAPCEIEVSSEELRAALVSGTSHRHKLNQKKLGSVKLFDKRSKDENVQTGSSSHKTIKQKQRLVKKCKFKSPTIPNENSSSSTESIAIDSENLSKRTCIKCGKELGRKKICYDCELTCKYCGKSYANYKTRGRRGLLRVHVKSHEGDKSHICETCGKAFTHLDYMKRHVKMVHSEEDITFFCKICSKTFKNNHCLQIHIRSIHNTIEESLQCHICGSIFKRKGSLLAHHRRVHVHTNTYKCEHCGTMWKSSDSLRSHIKTVHKLRARTVCYICGAMLLSPDMLTKHIMRHKNKRMYQCTKCDKRFYTSHEARQHYRVHSGAKPFQCHLCKYATAVKGNLTKHMKIHRNGGSIPKHNYTGHDYDVNLEEEEAEFVKLDESIFDEAGA